MDRSINNPAGNYIFEVNNRNTRARCEKCSKLTLKTPEFTKHHKRNKATSKKFDDDVMSANCDIIVIFPIDGQLGAIRKPDSERMVCKTYIFINSKLLSYKN